MPSAKHVDMQVIDGLAAVLSRVDHHAISIRQPLGAGDISSLRQQVSEKLCMVAVGVRKRGDVLAGHYQEMYRRLRLDIRKRVAFVVLINSSRRNGSRNDFAEQAVHIGTSVRSAPRGEQLTRFACAS